MHRRSLSFICVLVLCAALMIPAPVRTQENQEPASPAASEQKTQPPSDGRQGQLIMPQQAEEDDERDAEAEDVTEGEKTTTAARTREDVYIIKRGDTLWDISSAFLRDPFLWPLIWKVNPYITNPDLIYPGNKLTIPSLAPIEKALEIPDERPPEKEIVEAKAPPLVRPRRPATPVEEEEEAPPRRILILPEEEKVPLINKYAMLNAGFVHDDESDDEIVGSTDSKTIFGYDDVVYVRIRSIENVQVGERFLIYSPLKKVKHPKTGRSYGRLIKILGVLKIINTDRPNFTARITISFDAISKGAMLTPYVEPGLVYDVPTKDKKLSGYILEVMDGRTINAQTDIVYLDIGTTDGVEPGDRLSVFIKPPSRAYPKKLVGEVIVFLVKERTSTAVVSKSVDTLAKGDMIESKK